MTLINRNSILQITYDNYFVIIGDNNSDLNYNYLRKQITMNNNNNNNYNLYEYDKMIGYRKRIKIKEISCLEDNCIVL